jgi:hypothetical protein
MPEFRSELVTQLLAECGIAFDVLTEKERWEAQQRWRECFSRGVKARTGRWTYGGRDWNAFDQGFVRSLRDTKAMRAYLSVTEREFLVICEDEAQLGLACRGAPPPDFTTVELELYVFPIDLSWTMVFTHEGPFFSRAAWAH